MPLDVRYYRLDIDVERVRWIGCVHEKDWRCVVRVRDMPVRDEWEVVSIEWLPETIKGEIADIVQFTSNLRGISRRAREILSPYLSDEGEWLETDGLECNYYLYHVLTAVEGFNWERSTYIGDKSHLSDVSKYAISVEDGISLPDAFRIPEVLSSFIVSDRIRTVVEESSLTGFLFSDVEIVQK